MKKATYPCKRCNGTGKIYKFFTCEKCAGYGLNGLGCKELR